MSLANNFDIVYGANNNRIRIVTDCGEVAIMDDGDLHFLPGPSILQPPRLAALVVEYMIGGDDAMRAMIDADEEDEP